MGRPRGSKNKIVDATVLSGPKRRGRPRKIATDAANTITNTVRQARPETTSEIEVALQLKGYPSIKIPLSVFTSSEARTKLANFLSNLQ